MEANKVLERIRALLAKAESLEQSGDDHQANEAQACRARADDMMQKYAVEEWEAYQEAPSQDMRPTRIHVDIGEHDNPFIEELASLVNIVSRFAKCSSIWMKSGRTGQDYSWVYGYETDLRYFEMMYTSLQLHMSGAIFPQPDPEKTLQENAYELHNAGLNWLDIARAYGWVKSGNGMYWNRHSSEYATYGKSVGRIRSAYFREVARRGEVPLHIPPRGSEGYRRNAARGYLSRLEQRLEEIAGARGTGTELVLAGKERNIRDLKFSCHPDLRRSFFKNVTFNETAYRKGVTHANSASLNPEAQARLRTALH